MSSAVLVEPVPNETSDHSSRDNINGLKNKKTDEILDQSLSKVNGVTMLKNVEKVLSRPMPDDARKSIPYQNGQTNGHHDYENSMDSNENLSEPNSNTSQDKPYRCHICDKLFSRNSSLKCHIRLHLEGPENILRSTSAQSTDSFEKTIDPLVINNDNEEKEITVVPTHSLEEETEFSCVLCDNHFAKKSALKHHIIECHMTTGQMDETATRQNSIEKESSPCNTDKEYACVICDQRFSRKSSLIMHYKNHPIEKPKNEIPVEDLPKFTVDITEAEHLLELFQNEVKSSSVLKQPVTLKKIDVTNEGDDKPYKCYVCDKQFARNSSLVWHIQFHETNLYSKSNKSEVFENEDTEYTCQSCNKRFESKIAYKKHAQCHKCDMESEVSVAAVNDESTPQETTKHKNTLPNKNGLYQCEICPKLFMTCRAKNIHSAHAHRLSSTRNVDEAPSTTTHNNDGLYECHLCDRVFQTPRGLYRHMGYHNTQDQMAPKADDSSSDIDLSLDDLDEEEPDTKTMFEKSLIKEGDMFECEICQKSFTSSRAKNIHKSRAHRELSETSDLHGMDIDDEDNVEEAETSETEAEEFQCYECDRVFSSKRARSIHALQIHLEANSDETFECPLCGRSFISSRALHIHSSSQHKGEIITKTTTVTKSETKVEFQCKFCKRIFDSKRAMNIHISAQHRGKGSCMCDVCEKSFESSSRLRNHLQGICGTTQLVDGKLLYSCRVCSKLFNHPKSLLRHVREHENAGKPSDPEFNDFEEETEYKCPFCAQSFANVKSLAGHVKIHPRTPGDTLMKFELSTLRMKTEPSSRHSVTKTEVFFEKVTNNETKIYTCVLCNRYFNSSTGYAGHMKAHKGQLLPKTSLEKQIEKSETKHKVMEEVEDVAEYICNDCGERFLLKKDLIRHMRIHVVSSNLPLKSFSILCLHCKQPFNSEQSLRTHMYKFHRSKIIPVSGGAIPMEEEKQHICDLCSQSFGHYKELRRHSMLGCNGLPSQKRSMGEALKCEYCGQTFLLHCHLAKHLKSRCNAVDLCNYPLHNAEKYNESSPLGKRARKSTFVSSLYGYDSVARHKCVECGKLCSSKTALQKHLSFHNVNARMDATPNKLTFSFRKNGDIMSLTEYPTAHAQFRDKPYECVYCEKCFGEKTLLLEHVRTHAEANELDEVEFEKYISLHAGEHFLVQNSEGDEEHFIFEEQGDDEGYQCTECNETYHDKLQMIIHMTHHLNSKLPNGGHKSLLIKADATLLAPYKCFFCQERFINKKYRMQHLRKYHNEDILHCDVCGNLFLHKEKLEIHCKQHNVGTKYKCKFCDKCFTSKWFLKRHAKRRCDKKPWSTAKM